MKRRERVGWRVGLLVISALAVAGAAIVIIGGQNHMFRRMNTYTTRFENVKGLQDRSPVQLNGVSVGRVERIVLSPTPGDLALTVELTVEKRYAAHIRKDSQARIKTVGLLGDKFVEISAGQPDQAELEDGAEIAAVQVPSVDALLDSGEDVVDNVGRITVSLTKILERVEKGEGLLGQLVAPLPEADKDLSLTRTVRKLTDSLERITVALDQGRSPVSRLLTDEQLGTQLGDGIARFDQLMVAATEGKGALPRLMNDAELAGRVERSLANLEKSTADLAAVTANLRSDDGGLVPKLLNDEQYGREVTGEIEKLLQRLDHIVAALERGDGTAGKLIHDPAIYEALNDIIVGVHESKMLSWLIRNRQKAGIEKRYSDAQTESPDGAKPPAEDGNRP